MFEMFEYGFMVRAFVAGTMVALIAPHIGVFLVLRRQAFFSDALSHIALLGVAIGFLAGLEPVLMAVLIAAISAAGMVSQRLAKRVFSDAVLALFLYGSLAAAVILMGLGKGSNVDLLGFLFGSIVTVGTQDLYLIGTLGFVVVSMVWLFYKELVFASFDEEAAKASGIPVGALNTLLIVLAAVVVSLAIRTVGALLIGALIVIPVISAMQFARSFRQTIFFSVALGLVAVVCGLFLSYHAGLASGAMIVAVAMAVFLMSCLASAWRPA